MKKFLSILLVCTLVLGLGSVLAEGENFGTVVEATLVIKDMGEVKLELYPDVAPQSVANFVELAKAGFYDGLTFHRIIKDFMIQGGDPEGTGMGGPGYSIKGEFASNGFENPISHIPGTISWARTNVPDTAGSQFFIVHGNATSLDGNYAAFGRVVSGFEYIDQAAKVETGAQDKPVEPVIIEKITIDTEVELPAVEKLAK